MGFKSFLRAILLGVDWDLAIALGVIDLIVGASLAISTLGAAGIVILVGAALVGIGGLGFWLRLLKQRASQRERIVGYYSAHKSANGNVSITAMQIWSVHADSWPESKWWYPLQAGFSQDTVLISLTGFYCREDCQRPQNNTIV